jgi:hypothetical protein
MSSGPDARANVLPIVRFDIFRHVAAALRSYRVKQNSRAISDPAAVIHLLFRLSISPEILRGFRINNPCRPYRLEALEEFFPFQESP